MRVLPSAANYAEDKNRSHLAAVMGLNSSMVIAVEVEGGSMLKVFKKSETV